MEPRVLSDRDIEPYLRLINVLKELSDTMPNEVSIPPIEEMSDKVIHEPFLNNYCIFPVLKPPNLI